MARYEVYRTTGGTGYLLDVQANLLDSLNTRIAVPLMLLNDAPEPARRLNPVFDVEGESVVMVTQFLAAVPASELKTPVANLDHKFDDITNALDMVFQGF